MPRVPALVLLAAIAALSILLLPYLYYHPEACRSTQPTSRSSTRLLTCIAANLLPNTPSPEDIQDTQTEADAQPLSEAELLLAQPFPSKIWQSWKDDSEDPTDRTVGFPHLWRDVNPGWRYERLTDANIDAYVRDNFDADLAAVFTGLGDPILKADFLRYLILYREGGVWADIDVHPHQPVSNWVPAQYQGAVNLVVGIENDHHKEPIWPGLPYSVQLCQYTVLAKPGHPAISTLVQQVSSDLQQLHGPATFEDVMATTGPFAFTQVLMDYFRQQTGVEHTGDDLDSLAEPRLIGDVLVLPKDSFGWLPHENTHQLGDPLILVEHLFIGSWRDGHVG